MTTNTTTKPQAKTENELLYDALTTIYKEIEKLRRGQPIALAKATTGLKQLQIRKTYNKKLAELKAQYNAVEQLWLRQR